MSFCTIFAHSLSNTHFFNRQSHLFFLFNLNTLAHSDLLYICPCLSHLLSHTIHSYFVSPSYSISLHTLSLSLSISLFLSLPLSLTLSNAVLYLSYSTSISLTRPLSLLLVLYLSYSTSIFNSISYCTSIFTSIYFSLTHSHYVCVSHAAFQAYTCFPHSHTLPHRAYLSR